MSRNQQKVSAGSSIRVLLVLVNGVLVKSAYLHGEQYYWWLLLSVPLLFFVVFKRNYKRNRRKCKPVQKYPVAIIAAAQN